MIRIALDDRPGVQAATVAVGDYIEGLTEAFRDKLVQIVSAAQAATIARLSRHMDLDGRGRIKNTRPNYRALRNLDEVFQQELRSAGYDALVQGFVQSWHGTLPLFDDVLAEVVSSWKRPPKSLAWNSLDFKTFSEEAFTAKEALLGVADIVGQRALQKSLMSIAGVNFSDLVGKLSKEFSKTLPESVSLASTVLPTFYRTIADQGFQKIEANAGKREVLYTYQGPDDKLTRPFCRKVLRSRRPYSRAEIESMDNGQGLSVMTACGGWNCRHQWVLWIPSADQNVRP